MDNTFITQIQFELLPEKTGYGSQLRGKKRRTSGNARNQGFRKKRAYYFRGVFLSWMKNFKEKMAKKLHDNQPKDTPLFIRRYALQQDILYMNHTKGHKSTRNNNRRRGRRNRKNTEIGLKYTITSLDGEISEALKEYIMTQKNQTLRYGHEKAIIHRIHFNEISLDRLYRKAVPIEFMDLYFLTPTSYNMMGSSKEMRFPLPQYFFGNLSRIWNNLQGGSGDSHSEQEKGNSSQSKNSRSIPKDFFPWVEDHVLTLEYKLRTDAWDQGKPVDFVGFLGGIKMKVKVDHSSKKDIEYARWLDVLLRLGVLTNTGKGRTTSFGRFRVKRTSQIREK